ncbi:NADPH-dependent F420 reductase [Kamptonema formosum]|uniref:NADPH-dependent F420 reductase n=1 Tax=Kamptonema formosum TaxID=331992 RepID=UPI00034B3CA6|nr:NADPH-dependent F420 reductase [Oscillatoria sp. PCC 10802]
MKIGVIGAGNVGGALGRILAGKGHEIVFGVRDPQSSKVQSLIDSTGGKAKAGSVQEAAAHGEVVILATPWQATQEAIEQAGDLSGKILIDCTNPLGAAPNELVIGLTTSAAEEIAKWAAGARVVKAFNNIGASCFENLTFGSQQANTFICGEDAEAKKVVMSLAQEIGFEPVDTGDLSKARLAEPLAALWIHLAYFQGMGPDFAVNLVKR